MHHHNPSKPVRKRCGRRLKPVRSVEAHDSSVACQTQDAPARSRFAGEHPAGRITFAAAKSCTNSGRTWRVDLAAGSAATLSPIYSSGATIELVSAPTSSDLALYHALKHQMYEHYGVLPACRVNATGPCAHLVLARAAEGHLLGGMALYDSRQGELPVEVALGGNARLRALLSSLGRTVEPSGLVVSSNARKTGLAYVLIRIAVAALPLLSYGSAVGMGHQHVLPMYRRFGFMPARGLGSHAYPDARYTSKVVILRATHSLASADPDERRRMLAMRSSIRAIMLADECKNP